MQNNLCLSSNLSIQGTKSKTMNQKWVNFEKLISRSINLDVENQNTFGGRFSRFSMKWQIFSQNPYLNGKRLFETLRVFYGNLRHFLSFFSKILGFDPRFLIFWAKTSLFQGKPDERSINYKIKKLLKARKFAEFFLAYCDLCIRAKCIVCVCVSVCCFKSSE